jgi:hypothetical protein
LDRYCEDADDRYYAPHESPELFKPDYQQQISDMYAQPVIQDILNILSEKELKYMTGIILHRCYIIQNNKDINQTVLYIYIYNKSAWYSGGLSNEMCDKRLSLNRYICKYMRTLMPHESVEYFFFLVMMILSFITRLSICT